MVSSVAVNVTAEEVETWMGLGILPLQNPLFLDGNQWLQLEWRRGWLSSLCRGKGRFRHWGRWRLSRISSNS